MIRITIEEILQEICGKINHLQLPELRAENVCKLLKIELDKLNSVISSEALNVNIPITDVQDKMITVSEISFAIVILTRYELSKSFALSIPDINSEALSKRRNFIVSLLTNLVN